MNEGITDREALYIGDLLSQEAIAVDKFSHFANESNDPEIKAICRELVSVHMRHFDRLLQQINVSSIGAGQSIGASTRFATTGTWSQGYTPSVYTQSNMGVGGSNTGYGYSGSSSQSGYGNPSYSAGTSNQGIVGSQSVSGSIGGTGYEAGSTGYSTGSGSYGGQSYGTKWNDGYNSQTTGTRWS